MLIELGIEVNDHQWDAVLNTLDQNEEKKLDMGPLIEYLPESDKDDFEKKLKELDPRKQDKLKTVMTQMA